MDGISLLSWGALATGTLVFGEGPQLARAVSGKRKKKKLRVVFIVVEWRSEPPRKM